MQDDDLWSGLGKALILIAIVLAVMLLVRWFAN
jgi:hypothetical protein